jgi:signal peptidase II
VAAAAVLLAALLTAGRRFLTPATTVALGLVVGGAVGNLGDRLFRHAGGAVVDFVDLRWWPVFNVADAAITAGALLLLLGSRRA